MSEAEKKAVLDLFPYFSKNPVVFDVGSNKGDFAELFVDRVSEIHLFEPNELLLHYSMVRFCDRKNVRYNDFAIADSQKKVLFKYFTDSHNGLSNIINNPKWDYLGFSADIIDASTLDYYWQDRDEVIDLVKLDVEGAEHMALIGSMNLLINKKIKFIQVENAEHINVTGKTFLDLVDYLNSFGYSPIQTDDTENVIFAMEGFTQNWNSEFKKYTEGIKCNFALEIGCFEGLTSRYICDNMLLPGGRMICIDPLTDEYLPDHPDNAMFVGQFERFSRNTRGYPIELIRKKSRDTFHELRDYRFDFIYVDGDHTYNEVFNDAQNAFHLCKVGGYILFDDYDGYREETTRGINDFLKQFPPNKLTVEKKGYQVLCKKHENWV